MEEQYEEHPGSKFLQHVGFRLRFYPPLAADPSTDENQHQVYVFFDATNHVTQLLRQGTILLQINQTRANGGTYQDHQQLTLIDDPESKDGQGRTSKRLGFCFTATRRTIECIVLYLDLYDAKQLMADVASGKETDTVSGAHTLVLREFLPTHPVAAPTPVAQSNP